ncbi:MAG: hypothetical protein E6R13_01435 [Spirochaetes bacterium]|nr:MAG: hypothetical protein E6R13_01435 [Spirochaetota bacterium]
MKERINEHDMTKKMMDIMRGGYKPLLSEEATNMGMSATPQEGEPAESKDVITPVAGDAVFNDELKKLQDTVDPRVKITSFKIYPVDENVIIEGVFLQREKEGTGIIFRMSLAAGEIETSMNDIELSDKVSLLLQKLKGYYENWVDEWALKLPNEYRPKEG